MIKKCSIILCMIIATLVIYSMPVYAMEHNDTYSIFSWTMPNSSDELAIMMSALADYNIYTIYQYFPVGTSFSQIKSYMSMAKTHGIRVYYLDGEPDWSLDMGASSMKQVVLRVHQLNLQLGSEYQLAGIMMDAEPYLTDMWQISPEDAMKQYVGNMIAANNMANHYNLEYIACVPYFYDSSSLNHELEALIDKGCSRVAVMNYNRQNEASQILNEYICAAKCHKPLIVIYELQNPEEYDLSDNNTYWSEGLASLTSSIHTLNMHYDNLTYAYHEYNSWRQLIDRK